MPITSRRTLFVLLTVFASIFAVFIASPKGAFTAIGTSLQNRLDKKIATKLSRKPVVAAQSSAPAFSLTGMMKEKRIFHAATLLNNGLVLVTGGDTPSIPTKTAELYDSQTGMWRYTQATMNIARGGHTTTLLQDGRVLIAGGGPETNTAEIYDPTTETFTLVKPMNVTRVQHRAILLKDGRVLVVAGSSRSGVGGAYATNAAEIYDPTTGNWSLTDPLPFAVTYHTATLLPDGSVLVAGGYNGFNNDSHVSSIASYNPITGKWKSMEPMQVRRTYHTATLLANGKVLIAGGNNTSTTLDSSEIYDPNAGTNGQSTLGNTVKMGGWGSRAVGMKDGNVLLLGGEFISSGGASPTPAAQIFNPTISTFTDVGPMKAARAYATATILPSGQVLIAGGQEAPGVPLASAELWGTQFGCTPPTITTPPANQSITAGQTATLNVVANGTAPLTYQWYEGVKGDTSKPVGTNAASFTSPVLTASKSYWLRISNSCGSTNSDAVTITVTPCIAPTISAQPMSQVVEKGGYAVLKVEASGSTPIKYQWYKGDRLDRLNPISGVNSNTYIVVAPSEASSKYWVEISNSCGTDSSNSVTVEVSEVEVTDLEVTQGLQNLNNSVVLIAEKRTFVRAHVKSTNGLTIKNVSAVLIGSKDGKTLPGSPLTPINYKSNVYRTGDIDVSGDPDRAYPPESFFFDLPKSWLHGTIELEIKGLNWHIKCGQRIQCSIAATFRDMLIPEIRVVGYHWERDGTKYPLTNEYKKEAIRQIESRFPISKVSWDNPYDDFDFIRRSIGSSPRSTDDFILINQDLLKKRKLDGCKSGCKKFYMGLLVNPPRPSKEDDFYGLAYRLGNVFSGYVIKGTEVLAHEFGHTVGRKHTDYNAQNGQIPKETDTGYHEPADGTISQEKDHLNPKSIYGFELYNDVILIYRPDTPDMMSYGLDRWVSLFTYNNILDYLRSYYQSRSVFTRIVEENDKGSSLKNELNSDAVLLSGTINLAQNTGHIDTIYALDSPDIEDVSNTGEYTIRFEDALGKVINTYNFDLSIDAESNMLGSFSLALPKPQGVFRIFLLHNNQVLYGKNISLGIPTTKVSYPNGGEMLPNTPISIRWSANDPDGDPLKYVVQYSPDAGVTWRTLATDLTSTSLELDPENIAGTSQGLIRVQASDGFNTAHDISDAPFSISKHAPIPTIESPKTDTVYIGDSTITFWGSAFDKEDGQLSNASLKWNSDLSGDLGSGESLTLMSSGLAKGTHTITLTAFDKDGQTGSTSIKLTISSDRPHLPARLSISPQFMNFPVKRGDGPTGAQVLAIRNDGDGELSWVANVDQNWIHLNSTGSNAPANLQVIANATGLNPGQYKGSITITSSGAENSPQTVRVILNVAAASDLSISQSITPDLPVIGSNIIFTLKVKNNGADPSESITIADNLSPLVTFISCSATNNGVCSGLGNNHLITFPTLASGATATVTLVAKVVSNAPGGTVVNNTATVSSVTFDPNLSNNSSTVSFNVISPEYEADVSPRPNGNGNGTITMSDWVQLGRFFAKLDTPAIGSEFQRADCAPKATRGDGAITIADWVQAGRYAVGLDAIVPAGGPSSPSLQGHALLTQTVTANEALTRTLRTKNTHFQRGQLGTLPVELDAQGNENAIAFSVNFDPKQLNFWDAKLGEDAMGATLQINATQAIDGHLGLALILPPGQQFTAGKRTIATIHFIPNGGEKEVQTSVSFSDQLFTREIVDALAVPATPVIYEGSKIIISGKAAANVSAASYLGTELATESIASAFGTQLATMTVSVASLPLPTMLGGTSVQVKDAQGGKRMAPLFFVSPTQINYQIPAGTAMGLATVTITNGAGEVTTGLLTIVNVAPALFTADATGKGIAAGSVLYVRTNGSRREEVIARFDIGQNQLVAIPIDVSSEGEQTYLTLYGTGIRNRSHPARVKVRLGELEVPVEYTGPQGTYVGLDQINVKIPPSLGGRGELNVSVIVDGIITNLVTIKIK